MTTASKYLATFPLFICVTLIASTLLISCSPQKSEDQATSQSKDESLVIEFSATSDCAGCHEGESQQISECLTTLHPDLTCTDCHAISDGTLEQAHKEVTDTSAKPTKLKATTVPQEFCFSCHGSYEELATKTQEVTSFTDSEGTCINPHEAPQLSDDHTEDLTCVSCHGAHQKIEEPKESACITCHHADVFQCYTCHE